MKTRIYIDGYNLYYGCLKHTPYKWLDLAELFRGHLLPRSAVRASTLHPQDGIKFYTAEISQKAAQDPDSVNDQRSYHAALTGHSRNAVKIIKGSYSIDQVDSRKVEFTPTQEEKEPRDCSTVKVWKLEEKQSDVNVAVDAVFDVLLDHTIEQVVFVTNDTDIAPALSKIRLFNDLSKRPPVTIGLIVPARARHGARQVNQTLSDLADWTIDFIADSELAASQLPCRVTGGKKPALRPASWFKHKQEVEDILDILCSEHVLQTLPRAWRWLSEEKPNVQGLPILAKDPSTMLHDLDGIKAVHQHVCAYADYLKNAK